MTLECKVILAMGLVNMVHNTATLNGTANETEAISEQAYTACLCFQQVGEFLFIQEEEEEVTLLISVFALISRFTHLHISTLRHHITKYHVHIAHK